jgi:hypothetical protein
MWFLSYVMLSAIVTTVPVGPTAIIFRPVVPVRTCNLTWLAVPVPAAVALSNLKEPPEFT